MTYQEIQDRLSKCESTLEQLKNGSVKPTEKITVKNLELLKESLEKQLSEADKGIVYTDDEVKAKDLADKGANVKLTSEMKPGDEEDLERRRFNQLSRKDQNTLIAIRAMMDKEKAKNEAPDGPPISKMTRADMIDFLNTTPEKVKHMSDDELRDYTVDKNSDLREDKPRKKIDLTHNDGGMSFADNEHIVGHLPLDSVEDFGKAIAQRHFPKDPKGQKLFFQQWMTAWREGGYDDSIDEQPADAPADLSEAVDPSITDLLVQFVTLMGMGYGVYQAAKKLSDKHGDINLDSIKAALSKKEDKEKDDYGRNHYPEKGEYIKLGDEEREAMKNNKLGIKENEIGDADDNVGMGYKNARDIINYLREKIYPYMDDAELQEFNDEMHTHFASNSSRFVKEGDDICSCCNNPIVNGSCGCPDDCPHCGGKGKVDEDDVDETRTSNVHVPTGDLATNKYDKAEKFKTHRVGFRGKDPFDDKSIDKQASKNAKSRKSTQGIKKAQKAYDLVVNKMKELAKQYKAGDKSVVDQLKDLTAKKRKLQDMLDQDVSNIGRNQELTEVNKEKNEEKRPS